MTKFICEKDYACCDYFYADTLEHAIQESDNCPHLIEMTEVVHAYWKATDLFYFGDAGTRSCVCSACGKLGIKVMPYCPWCHAIMDSKKKGEQHGSHV